MSPTPNIHKITIFPFKSLDGVEVQQAEIAAGGCLLHDREYAIVNDAGKYVNGKSTPKVNLLRTEFDFENNILSIKEAQQQHWNYFNPKTQKAELEKYLSDYFEESVHVMHNSTGRFIDVPDLSGVTVISNASLLEVSTWYENTNLVEKRNRFRATLEIEGVPAFWEDRLFLKPGTGIEFKIGGITMFGVSPRARCVVPTRHPQTAAVIPGFPKIFSRKRVEHLPSWSNLNNYDHHYYLSVDCYIPATEYGKQIAVGDELEIIGEKQFY